MRMKTKQFHFISDELEKKKTDDVDIDKNDKKTKSSEKSAENRGGEVQVIISEKLKCYFRDNIHYIGTCLII
jgi:hypothetical protein